MTILTRPNDGQTILAAHVDQLVDLYKGNQIFDLVNTYGCDPTGAVECSTAVNQAFTDAAASGKSALVTGYGTLKVGHKIVCSADNIALIGQGAGHPDHMLNGLCFKAAASFPDSRILDFSQQSSPTRPLSGNRIENVAVDGNSFSGTNVCGIYFSVHDGLLDFSHVAYCSGWGVQVQGVASWTTYNTQLRSTRVHNCNSGGFLIDTIASDVHATNVWAYYCGLVGQPGSTVNNAGADGMQVTSSGLQVYGYHAYSNTADGYHNLGTSACQVEGSYLENNGKHGFHVDNTSAGSSGLRLVNSYVWANGTVAANTYDNVCVAAENGGANGCSAIMLGNHIAAGSNTNKPRYGINLANGSAQSCVADANYITGSYGTGLVHGNGNTSTVPCLVINNPGYNPVGPVTQPTSITASPFTWNNAATGFNTPATVFITAGSGSISVVQIAGTTTGLTIAAAATGMIRILPGQSIGLTYSGTTPTWTWFLD